MALMLVYGVFLKEKDRQRLYGSSGILAKLSEGSPPEVTEVILGKESRVLSLPVASEEEFPSAFSMASASRVFRHELSWAKRKWRTLAKLISREFKGKIKLGEPELLIVWPQPGERLFLASPDERG